MQRGRFLALPGADRRGPVACLGREAILLGPEAAQADISAGSNRHIAPPGQRKGSPCVAGALPLVLQHAGDAGQFEVVVFDNGSGPAT